MTEPDVIAETGELYVAAEWYDRSVNWNARLTREIPVFVDLFGGPGEGGLLDAGCGTGHQAGALAARGYRVVGADGSKEMLEIARRRTRDEAGDLTFALSTYAKLHEKVGGGFDGIYCIGNSLAASGSREAAAEAVKQFGKCLRPGGRLFIQVLNFPYMRSRQPYVIGPRVSKVDGQEYISVRQFHFVAETAQVTSISLWNDGTWRQRAHCGTLYPMSLDELRGWCDSSGLHVESTWHSYAREPFDPERSTDLIVVARRE